ncbi:MAG: hypothetical protein SF162_02150 [bacterium]|nr:hypothetical protein [bacterium]
MSQVKVQEYRKRKGLRPLIGVMMAIAVGIIAWFLAPGLLAWMKAQNSAFGRGVDDNVMLAGVGIAIFLVLISLASVVFAAAAPKPKTSVKETDLMKERQEKKLMDAADAKRQQRLNRQMRQDVRARSSATDDPNRR